MTSSPLPVAVPILFLLFAPLALLLGLWRRELARAAALAAAALAWASAVAGLAAVLDEGTLRYAVGGWPPPLGIELVLDPLSGFVQTVVTSVALLVLICGGPLVRDQVPGKALLLYPTMLLLLAGLSGMVATGDLFNLYVFLEIASIAAYALIASGDDRRAPVAAFRYLVLGSIAGGFYLLGVGLLYFATGTLNMADMAGQLEALQESRVVLAAAALMVLGLGLKMGLFPLHVWLPDAYTWSPYAVSALIAPVMTKVSAYAIIRLVLDVFGVEYLRDRVPALTALGWLGAAGVVVASLLAVSQRDYRRMLAYSSVGQLGFVALGVGLGSALGLVGALLHILNHAVMKGCLFLVGGAIHARTGRLEVPRFAGLGRRMPWTMACFSLASLSMIGIPPTAGFFSKWYLALASLEAGQWVFFAVIVSSSLLTALYLFRVLESVYLAPQQDAPAEEQPGQAAQTPGAPRREAPAALLVPIALLAAAVLVLGLGNAVIVEEVLAHAALPLEPK